MEAINPVGMIGSLEPPVDQLGELDFTTKPIGFLEDDEKKALMGKVMRYSLSDHVNDFAEGYAKTFRIRNNFLWKWLGVVYETAGVTLSTVEESYVSSTTDAKILLTVAFSILDDVSEVWKDEDLLENIIYIIRNPEDKIDDSDEKLHFFKNIWNHLLTIFKSYPRYEEFKDIFWYDFEQMLNSVRYNVLVNKNPGMINLQDMHNYDCHNMIVFLLNGIDLMVSPGFNTEDLPLMRKAFWHAQQMARIGNWLSTWKREVKEKDFCSGVFAYAFENKIVTIKEIETLSPEEIIDRIEQSGMKQYFLKIWKKNFQELASLKQCIHSVDMDAYVKGLENVIKYHMASEGLK